MIVNQRPVWRPLAGLWGLCGLVVGIVSLGGSPPAKWSVVQIAVVIVAGAALVLLPALAISRYRQQWAVLVGYSDRLQIVYPFGLHHLVPGTTLSGDPASAELVELGVESRPWSSQLLAFSVRMGDAEREFRLPAGTIEPGYMKRFMAWRGR